MDRKLIVAMIEANLEQLEEAIKQTNDAIKQAHRILDHLRTSKEAATAQRQYLANQQPRWVNLPVRENEEEQ